MKIKLRENFYLAAIGAVALDFGSTIIVTLERGRFAEFNPIAQALGFPGTIVYGLVMIALIGLVLFKWGLSWAERKEKDIFFIDLIAVEVFAQGIFNFLHNYGFISLVHSYRDFYILIGTSSSFAAFVSFLINHRLLLARR